LAVYLFVTIEFWNAQDIFRIKLAQNRGITLKANSTSIFLSSGDNFVLGMERVQLRFFESEAKLTLVAGLNQEG
jgi:hypothetical protein